jgi:hypothetical protein
LQGYAEAIGEQSQNIQPVHRLDASFDLRYPTRCPTDRCGQFVLGQVSLSSQFGHSRAESLTPLG